MPIIPHIWLIKDKKNKIIIGLILSALPINFVSRKFPIKIWTITSRMKINTGCVKSSDCMKAKIVGNIMATIDPM